MFLTKPLSQPKQKVTHSFEMPSIQIFFSNICVSFSTRPQARHQHKRAAPHPRSHRVPARAPKPPPPPNPSRTGPQTATAVEAHNRAAASRRNITAMASPVAHTAAKAREATAVARATRESSERVADTSCPESIAFSNLNFSFFRSSYYFL